MKKIPFSPRQSVGKFLAAISLVLLAALVVGCGNKGDLVRPGPPPATLQSQ